MSKARDLANAGTALTTVSATELGYVDGVTSAIQTQLDAKLATATATSTYIPKTLTTTTGDTIYASSANTPARLGIGTTGQVLTVAGGVPTWATASSGGKSFSLLSTTSLSGSTTTITGISNKDSLLILVDGGSSGNASATFTLRFNSDSSAVYNRAGALFQMNGSYDPSVGFSDSAIGTTSFTIGKMSASQTSVIRSSISVDGANSTGFKRVAVNGAGSVGGSDGQQLVIYQGTYDGTSTISSVSIITSAGTFDAGTVYIYGSA